jgi:hypothetical protein
MYPLGTWFASAICVWIPCIKETVMMMMMIIIIIIIIKRLILYESMIFQSRAELILQNSEIKLHMCEGVSREYSASLFRQMKIFGFP